MAVLLRRVSARVQLGSSGTGRDGEGRSIENCVVYEVRRAEVVESAESHGGGAADSRTTAVAQATRMLAQATGSEVNVGDKLFVCSRAAVVTGAPQPGFVCD